MSTPRRPKFTEEERLIIVTMYRQFKDVLELFRGNRTGNSPNMNAKKIRYWGLIADAINSKMASDYHHRSPREIRNRFIMEYSNARQLNAQHKAYIALGNTGDPPPPITPPAAFIMEHIMESDEHIMELDEHIMESDEHIMESEAAGSKDNDKGHGLDVELNRANIDALISEDIKCTSEEAKKRAKNKGTNGLDVELNRANIDALISEDIKCTSEEAKKRAKNKGTNGRDAELKRAKEEYYRTATEKLRLEIEIMCTMTNTSEKEKNRAKAEYYRTATEKLRLEIETIRTTTGGR